MNEVMLLDDTFRLSWCQEDNYFHVLMQANTLGWVGIGFTKPTSLNMLDADMIAGYVAENGTLVMDDFYGVDPTAPGVRDTELNDGTNDIVGQKGWEENGWTSIQFSRSLNTGDPNDARLDESGVITVLVAFGQHDNMLDFHTRRGRVTLSKYTSLTTYSKATGKFSYNNNSTWRYLFILLCTRIPCHQRLWEQQKQSHLGYDRRYLHVEK